MQDFLDDLSVRLDAALEGHRDEESLWRLYWFFQDTTGVCLPQALCPTPLTVPAERSIHAMTFSRLALGLQSLLVESLGEHISLENYNNLSSGIERLVRQGNPQERSRWDLLNYDWTESFGVAMREGVVAVAPDEKNVSLQTFTVAEVLSVLGSSAGLEGEEAWVAAGQLYDGRWFYVSAHCSDTGWGCSDSGVARMATTVQNLVLFGLDERERERLEIELEFPEDQ